MFTWAGGVLLFGESTCFIYAVCVGCEYGELDVGYCLGASGHNGNRLLPVAHECSGGPCEVCTVAILLPSRQRAVGDLEKDMYDVVCVQVEKNRRDHLPVVLATTQLLICVGPQRQVDHMMEEWGRTDSTAVRAKHKNLGGLTDAQGVFTWSSGMLGEVGFGKAGQPKRLQGRFLEPASKLLEWRSAKEGSHAWNPANGLSFPWPFPSNLPWFTTTTVFFKGKLIERPMTPRSDASSWMCRHSGVAL
jgi:hypothetical protein